MDQSGCRDERVPNRPRVRNVQHGTASGNSGIDGDDALGERGQHLLLQPPAQDLALGRVTSFGEENSDLQFLDSNH
jgi:hypothetical protein